MTLTKYCTRCKASLPINCFSKRSNSKDGLCSWCKECYSKWQKIYYSNNKNTLSEKHSNYYRANKKKCLSRDKKYRESAQGEKTRARYYAEHKQHILDYQKEYRAKNSERIKSQKREYQRKNKGKVAKWHKKYRETHKEQIQESSKRYREANRIKINSSRIGRLHTDSDYRMKEQIRNMVRYAFRSKSHHKNSRTKEIVGCDLDFLCGHLFKTWERNYGKPWNGEPYHIDHIIPLATAKTEEEVRRLCHYTNLQMLTPEDNLEKGATLGTTQ